MDIDGHTDGQRQAGGNNGGSTSGQRWRRDEHHRASATASSLDGSRGVPRSSAAPAALVETISCMC
jgi:hypothetical protein